MKNPPTPFLSAICILLFVICSLQSEISYAQINRSNTKKSVAYKANYQRMAAGGSHTLEIRDGTLWAWGQNTNGQLGDGATIDKSSQMQKNNKKCRSIANYEIIV